MKAANLCAASLALLLAPPAQADDISPGLWQLTIETRVNGSSDFAPAPYTLSQCFTASDASDPSRVLGQAANPGASDCAYTEKAYQGSTFRFTMRCAGNFGLVSRGEVSFTATTLDGTITATADLGGQKTEFSNRIRGRRVGGC
jgi:hypothetical protein